jgi:hypothetical protein
MRAMLSLVLEQGTLRASFMVGLLPLNLCLVGSDSQVHMTEDTEDAARCFP